MFLKNNEVHVNWDKYAVQYDAITMGGANPAYEGLVNKVSRFFSNGVIKKDSLFVDLGGGTGNFTIPIAKQYPDSKFLIVDTSEKMLEIAQQKAYGDGLKNIEVIFQDIEDISKITEINSRPITHAIMIHSLYTTGGINDDKPKRILRNIHEGLENSDSYFFISDINRQLDTTNWIPYCLGSKFRSLKSDHGIMMSGIKTMNMFIKNDQGKKANKYIDQKQMQGKYLICTLDEFIEMVKGAGFNEIYAKTDQYYRGRDNLIIAKK